MSKFQLKTQLSFDELMPPVMAINNCLVNAFGPQVGGNVSVALLATILANPDDVDRFVKEVQQLGAEEIEKRTIQFFTVSK